MQSSLPDVPDPLDTGENCRFGPRVGAYFDGELESVAAAEMQAHLKTCSSCRDQLDDIRTLSEQAKSINSEEISSATIRNIHRTIDADDRYVIFRIASVLTGLAASVMVVGAVWLKEIPDVTKQRGPVVITDNGPKWASVAMDLHVDPLPHSPWEVNEKQMFEDTRFAQAMVDGLTADKLTGSPR